MIRLTTKGDTIIASTILDEWGNRVINGSITEYGDTVYTESRAFSDVVSSSDTIVLNPIKSCIESLGVSDVLDPFNIVKVISNGISIIDSRVSSIVKLPIEVSITIGDTVPKILSRGFTDGIVLSDIISYVKKFLYEKRSKIVNKLLNSKGDQYED